MPGPGALIAGAVVAAAIASLFAAGDAALSVLPESRLAAVSIHPGVRASPFVRFIRNRERILSRWLVGRVLGATTATALLAEAATRIELGRFDALFAVLGAFVIYGTFAEVLSSFARRAPEAVGALALRFLRPLEWAMAPLAEPLALLGRFAARFAPERPVDARLTETEIVTVVDEGQKSGTLDREPAELIRNVLEFKDLTAREVMVPRTRISGIEVSTPIDKVRQLVATDGHSRYPVYRESLDQIIGLLYAKDLFRYTSSGETKTVTDFVRTTLLYVTESQPVASILREMRAKRLHMAIVSDEFGGTSGIVTLEDILEEIVGDIRDEHDVEGPFQDIGGGRVVADASVSLADLSAHLNRDIPQEGDFASLGGLVVHRVGHVPPVGAMVKIDGLRLIVREADQTRVVKVEIVPEERVNLGGSP
jgi:CBS domain containing-hemolysin-like protein